jgi:uncharacterized membrane protein
MAGHSRYRPNRHDSPRILPLAVAAGVLTLGGMAFWYNQKRTAEIANRPPDSAPGWTARQGRFGNMAVVGNSVTIGKPRSELYAYWRDFSNLPSFMENIHAVQVDGDMTTWTIRAPAGRSVTVKAKIVTDNTDDQIAWRSVEGSDIETEGKVSFHDAPGDRGTVVKALIAWHPPGGAAGQMIAKLFQADPAVQSRRDLKRFKMLMETGEVSTAQNRKTMQGETDARTDVSRQA